MSAVLVILEISGGFPGAGGGINNEGNKGLLLALSIGQTWNISLGIGVVKLDYFVSKKKTKQGNIVWKHTKSN